MVALSCYDDSPIQEETDYGYLLQANVIETLICGLLAQNKKDIF
jgi:hypothetical protein